MTATATTKEAPKKLVRELSALRTEDPSRRTAERHRCCRCCRCRRRW
ncbi:MAG TPA: hypothetical protein VK137_15245 [Planctomycetaceae bacterium]|nr:hypothetical protein [Planctomycetaceae bacterium]